MVRLNEQQSSVTGKAVLVISSHVVRGSVGNRAAAFALEVLGHPVWALPTVTLGWHPGHGRSSRLIAHNDDFGALCDDISNAPWRGELAGVITGYMGNCEQVGHVSKLVTALKAQNSDLVYLCDPVIGDSERGEEPVAPYGSQGRLYVAEETAHSIREHLLPLAEVATPNLFELAWLSDERTITDQSQMLKNARLLGVNEVLVTSVPALMRGNVASVLVNKKEAIMSEHLALTNAPNGVGDLASALFMSHKLDGNDRRTILEKTTASVFEILARTTKQGGDELALESNLASLQKPMAMVNLRALK